MAAITCHCRHVLSIPLCECNSIALHHRYMMQFFTLLKDVVGFLDCVRVHIQSIQVAIPQVTQVWHMTCVCSFYKLNHQSYLLCLFMICRYRLSPAMLLCNMLYESGIGNGDSRFIQHIDLCKETFVEAFQFHVFTLAQLVKSHLHVG